MKTYLKPIVIATSLMMSGAYASQSLFLNPVVVTGENSPSITQPSIDQAKARVKEIPGGASIVDMENVREGRTSTWVDMLGMAPGVFVQERFGSEEARIAIRGSGLARTRHGLGLKVMQDGIPINYISGDFDMQTVDPTAARYVEVLRGPNASSYGGTTLGGAINLISSTGYDKRNLVRAEVGSFEYRMLQAQFGNYHEQADGKVFDYSVSVSGSAQNGYRQWSEQESQKIVSNFGVKINQNLENRFYFAAANSNSHLPGYLTRSQLLSNPRQVGAGAIAAQQSRDLESYRIANKTTLRNGSSTYELAFYAMEQDLFHPVGGGVVLQKAQTYGGHLKWFNKNNLFGLSNETQLAFMPSKGKSKQNIGTNPYSGQNFFPANANQDGDNQSWLVENRTKLNEKTFLITALQYEYARRKVVDSIPANSSYDRSYEELLPRLGFIHNLTNQQQIFGNISRNFEAPSFGGATNMQASKAQTGVTYELGARGDYRHENIKTLFGWDLTLYRAELKNEFQLLCTDPANCSAAGATSTINVPKTIHQGIEAGIYSLTDNKYETRTSLLISDFKFDNDAVYGSNKLPGLPPLLVRSEVLYRWGPSHGARGLPGSYAGPKFELASNAPMDNTNTLYNPGYLLIGFKVGQQIDRSWSWFVDGRNLTDKRYAATTNIIGNSSNRNPNFYYPGVGRSFYFGIEKKLD
ncbi:MAG: TonB-dependent receptor [Burkholderiaceae bacterium]|jgi:iron complex outermembrane receptor protein|nr:TonB-dependent receptor [Burkholderiaceae bacterium]